MNYKSLINEDDVKMAKQFLYKYKEYILYLRKYLNYIILFKHGWYLSQLI